MVKRLTMKETQKQLDKKVKAHKQNMADEAKRMSEPHTDTPITNPKVLMRLTKAALVTKVSSLEAQVRFIARICEAKSKDIKTVSANLHTEESLRRAQGGRAELYYNEIQKLKGRMRVDNYMKAVAVVLAFAAGCLTTYGAMTGGF